MLIQGLLFLTLIIIFSITHLSFRKGWASIKIYSQRIFTILFCLNYTLLTFLSFYIYLRNIWNVGIFIYSFGHFLNLIVIISNKGRMPVDIEFGMLSNSWNSIEEMKKYIKDSRTHKIMSDKTHFNFLGDRHGSSLQSIGDITLLAGYSIWFYTTIFYALYSLFFYIFTFSYS